VKGGGGKTTLAVHLAVREAAAGHSTVLLDGDPQRTASDFAAIREEECPKAVRYKTVSVPGRDLYEEVKEWAPKYDKTVVDAGGRDSPGFRAALSVAELCVVPLVPASFDVWALEQVAEIAQQARQHNPFLRVYCVLNQADARGRDNEDAIAVVSEIEGIELLPCRIGRRKSFQRAVGQGMVVSEYKPRDEKAVAEIEEFYEAIAAAG